MITNASIIPAVSASVIDTNPHTLLYGLYEERHCEFYFGKDFL